jgi:hypothetical protein
MKDVVVGCITNYNFDTIKYWVNSLDRSGFSGHKIMICYNIDYSVCDELTKRNYNVIGFERNDVEGRLEFPRDFSIVVERFIHTWYFIKKIIETEDIRFLIATDVKDVIFQSNPSEWLEQNIGSHKINVGSESISYVNEKWGQNNMIQSFGNELYNSMKDKIICNAGTISGHAKELTDLMLNIYLICSGMPGQISGGGGPDQAAMNILLNSEPYKSITKVSSSEDGWCAQLGTTGLTSKCLNDIIEPMPILNPDNIVYTSQGKPFTLVHQYDRIPSWKKIIEEKYS